MQLPFLSPGGEGFGSLLPLLLLLRCECVFFLLRGQQLPPSVEEYRRHSGTRKGRGWVGFSVALAHSPPPFPALPACSLFLCDRCACASIQFPAD
jgi:hypothetical protein